MKIPRPIIFTGVKTFEVYPDAGLVQLEETPDSYSGDGSSNLPSGSASDWTGCDRCDSAYANHLEMISVCMKCHATLCPTCMGNGAICPKCTEQVEEEEGEFGTW